MLKHRAQERENGGDTGYELLLLLGIMTPATLIESDPHWLALAFSKWNALTNALKVGIIYSFNYFFNAPALWDSAAAAGWRLAVRSCWKSTALRLPPAGCQQRRRVTVGRPPLPVSAPARGDCSPTRSQSAPAVTDRRVSNLEGTRSNVGRLMMRVNCDLMPTSPHMHTTSAEPAIILAI